MKRSEGDIVIASVRPLCYLLLNHWTKSNQIWYVSYSHEWGVQLHNFFWSNIQFQLQSQFQRFLCVLTNERYKTYQMGFSFCCLGHASWVGLCGAGGAQGVKKKIRTWLCDISN